MKIINFDEYLLDSCAEFWWQIYENMPYVHRPDGYQTLNAQPIRSDYFSRHLKNGLSCLHKQHWGGEVNNNTILLSISGGKVEGILVSSVDRERFTGNILSAYMLRNTRGIEIAEQLLSEVLKQFRLMGLHRVIAAPGLSKSMEVECPIHLALLNKGFAWQDDWYPAYPKETYGVFLGGSLDGFRLAPEIGKKIENLQHEGITVERCTADHFGNFQRLDTGEEADAIEGEVTFVALVNSFLIGWLTEVQTSTDEYDRITGGAVPYVLPIYRNKGIGKVLYHLGIEEVVAKGAQIGWTATGIYNPARLIYQSIGYRYWYTCFSRMLKLLL